MNLLKPGNLTVVHIKLGNYRKAFIIAEHLDPEGPTFNPGDTVAYDDPADEVLYPGEQIVKMLGTYSTVLQ